MLNLIKISSTSKIIGDTNYVNVFIHIDSEEYKIIVTYTLQFEDLLHIPKYEGYFKRYLNTLWSISIDINEFKKEVSRHNCWFYTSIQRKETIMFTNKSKLKQVLLKEMQNARKSKCLDAHKNKWLHSLQHIWDVCIERNRF